MIPVFLIPQCDTKRQVVLKKISRVCNKTPPKRLTDFYEVACVYSISLRIGRELFVITSKARKKKPLWQNNVCRASQ